MIDKRTQADRILTAELFGEARHHARWRPLTRDEHAAAVAALRELAGGRADLLAYVAGISEGASEGQHDEALHWQIADLCRDAGADETLVPEWIEEGRRRRAEAGKPPFSAARRDSPHSAFARRGTESGRPDGSAPQRPA